jgi:signal transduction histidine kinase/CheY-like chemotaxis protein
MEERAPIESLENVNLTRDGREILLETNGRPIFDEHGELIGYRGVDRDITERKSLEAQLHHSQKMEAIGQLAGGVAHDFNNQLQAILGYAHLLLNRDLSNQEVRSHLVEIRKAAERAGALTKQLLAFGRRETLQPRILDVGRLIEDMTGMLRRLIGEQIELTVSTGRPKFGVHVDPGQIEQVVMNLSINARDAMPGGGTLRIETGDVSFDDAFCHSNPWARPGDYVRIRVTDTGTGIAPELRDRIFEPFFTTKAVGEGTGLGLATVYAIVDRHEGLISVESEPGKGSTFLVCFPASSQPPEASAPDMAPERPTGGTGTILVAEDDAIIRELTEEVLSEAGYDLLLARDGAEAIRLLKEHGGRIRLALLDVVMPEMGGREVHEFIREHQPGLPVLFCSGYSYSALERGRLPAGAANLIQKPYTPDELLAKIVEVLRT